MSTETTTSLTVAADLLSLRAIGPWLEENLLAAGDPDVAATKSKMELAVQEICVNVVKYAYGGPSTATIELRFVTDEANFAVTTSDTGQPYDPSTRREVDLENPTVGGYGLYLVESLCEQFDYDRTDDRNLWTMTFTRSVQVPS